MNDLCTEIGYFSLVKYGEELCGDHIDLVKPDDDNTVIVLADGLGSGVKACILSTLTSKIISTMMANNIPIEECEKTIAATLPVCNVRKLAYSTFTIICIRRSEEAEIIQYDNPNIILLRDGKNCELPLTTVITGGKTILRSKISLQENDTFFAMSDGAIHAGIGQELNFGWERENIISYMESMYDSGYPAKTLTTMLLDKCSDLYGGQPRDDTTVCTIKIRKRVPMNLMVGPPANPDDLRRMHSLFFAKNGKHIICGGTTSKLAAAYLHKKVESTFEYIDSEIPPIAKIDGVDLVTEGIITLNRVLENARDYLDDNDTYDKWGTRRDGASLISRMLFEEATDINFFVGKAVNPAHQDPTLPITFSVKMQLIDELIKKLEAMGKRIKASYF
ncbi:MAG: SpoIIE family protein phosphatase [Eubacteriales bacterium]